MALSKTQQLDLDAKKKYSENIIKYKLANNLIPFPSIEEVEPVQLTAMTELDLVVAVNSVGEVTPTNVMVNVQIVFLQIDAFNADLNIEKASSPVLYNMLVKFKELSQLI